MNPDFSAWLDQNGFSTVFITYAGDEFYANKDKSFGVIRRNNEKGAHSFYLDDIAGFQVYDDDNLVAKWTDMEPWTIMHRCTRASTREVYMKIYLKNHSPLRLKIFKADKGYIKRDSEDHVKLLNYSCQLAQLVYNLANKIS